MIAIRTKQLLSTTAAAAQLGVSTRRILQLVDADILPAFAIVVGDGRPEQSVFTIEDVERLVKTRARKVAGAK